MKLYIIGDSWATTPDQEFLDDPNTPVPWQFLLYEKLQADAIEVHAKHGTSIEWAVHQYYTKVRPQIKPEDCLLWVVTAPSRRWFFEDHPELSNIWMNFDGVSALSPQQRKAIDYYKKYLSSEHTSESYLQAMSSAISYDIIAIGASVIQAPGFVKFSPKPGDMTSEKLFNPYVAVHGSMESIGTYNFINEYDHVEDHDRWIVAAGKQQKDMVVDTGIDNRLNHISWKNHKELANRLYESFAHRKDLNLYNDFILEPLNTASVWIDYNKEWINRWKS